MRLISPFMQVAGLLLGSLATFFVGMSLFALFPLYAAGFGVGPTALGLALTLVYAANAAGPIMAGQVVRRVSRRRLFLATGLAGPITLILLGHATDFRLIVALMAFTWFCGGIDVMLLNIAMRHAAGEGARGRAYTLLGLTVPLGALLGGMATSQLLIHWDFAAVCVMLAGVWCVLPLVGLFTPDDSIEPAPHRHKAGPVQPGAAFVALLVASLLAHTAIDIGRLGTVLVMVAGGFAATDVASITGTSALAAMPLILLFGVLADRIGRRSTLTLSCVTTAAGMATLALATARWQLWLAAVLLLVALCTFGSLGAARVADLMAPGAFDTAMARYNAAGAIAGVLSFAVAGYAFEALGPTQLFAGAALLSLVAATLVASAGHRTRSGQHTGPVGAGAAAVTD